MNAIRSILSTVLGLGAVLCFSSPVPADSPDGVPIRLAAGQSNSPEVSVAQWVDDRFAAIEVVTHPVAAFHFDEEDVASDPDSVPDDETEEERQRRELMIARIAALRKPTADIKISTRPDGVTPENRAKELALSQPMISIGALGVPPAGPCRYTICFTHRPLYYEQRNLERCGNGHGCWQNGLSGAQFLWDTIWLPCQLGRQRCDSLVPAGGDCLTCQSYDIDCDPPLLNVRSIANQAAAVAGFTFLLL